jgi:EAL domain-containing protein (putative c-di-GMP-specific phosphodiesterase class I)
MLATLSQPESAVMHLHPLRQILSQASVSTHFQPIVSVKRKALIGVEALARATDPVTGLAVPPNFLFSWAREQERLLELDRLCQRRALEAFRDLPERDPELLLFMNVEASLLDQHPELSLIHAVHQAGVDPSQVLIEVNETHVKDQAMLLAFVERHRAQGFLIAMDDLGSGHSSLQRWPMLRPDVIKLDRSLVHGVAESFYAQELLRSLIALGRQTGALILAEGVEDEADVAACLDLGVDLFQGFYFAKPAGEPYANLEQALDKTQRCAADHKQRQLKHMARRRQDYERHSALARTTADVLRGVDTPDFARVLRTLPWDPAIESLVVLNDEGLQCSPTVFMQPSQFLPARGGLFQPPRLGADHSDRDYYYGLMESGLNRDCYLSEPHLSTASGQLCRTLSHRFDHPNGERYIACLEIGTA